MKVFCIKGTQGFFPFCFLMITIGRSHFVSCINSETADQHSIGLWLQIDGSLMFQAIISFAVGTLLTCTLSAFCHVIFVTVFSFTSQNQVMFNLLFRILNNLWKITNGLYVFLYIRNLKKKDLPIAESFFPSSAPTGNSVAWHQTNRRICHSSFRVCS